MHLGLWVQGFRDAFAQRGHEITRSTNVGDDPDGMRMSLMPPMTDDEKLREFAAILSDGGDSGSYIVVLEAMLKYVEPEYIMSCVENILEDSTARSKGWLYVYRTVEGVHEYSRDKRESERVHNVVPEWE